MVTAWQPHPATDLFPILDGEDLRALADDIAAHGLIEPVWLWRDNAGVEYLLDGRGRVAACEMAEVPVTHRWYKGGDPIAFIISENRHRRHLDASQLAMVALDLEALLARNAHPQISQKRREAANVRWKMQTSNRGHLHSDKVDTAGDAARLTGVSRSYVALAKKVTREAPELAAQVKAGTTTLPRAARTIRNRDALQRRVERSKAVAGTVGTIDIRHGDFRDVLADLHDVDAIVCDPPYDAEHLPLIGDLAIWADKVLAPQGILAVLVGQYHLPTIMRMLEGGRPYRWMGCYLTNGGATTIHSRGISCNWKPLLLYGNSPYPARFRDVIRTEFDNTAGKEFHEWGQDLGAFSQIVERLTEPGQTVVDPFMGGGTTLLAAHSQGRHVIGCDIDAAAVTTTKLRLGVS
ncbi:hypothetical protein AWB91_09090 [Mycobacterium paraense]|uniref:Methyltransferase n=1 Tax=Mycobacterium paraense TaxID=767916 RepID=A0ABX3VTD3_9MYCO|nr:DNA methyltransferase [Mycobacterium paraense]ORW33271.1 hypothetical protein AWB91_09090 [Mycobacterium paraense]ORW34668.1 hypothetical protein AWB88_02685 [Mycobacterium paraense]